MLSPLSRQRNAYLTAVGIPLFVSPSFFLMEWSVLEEQSEHCRQTEINDQSSAL